MTDEELGRRIMAPVPTIIDTSLPKWWTAVGASARDLLSKPVATREAVERRLEDSPVNAAWNNNTVLHIMDALSHFAPPASNAPILGMSVEEIEHEMRNAPSGPYSSWLIAARVAHRLAQPVPEADPDAEDEMRGYALIAKINASLPETWRISVEPPFARALVRAVASAQEKSDG